MNIYLKEVGERVRQVRCEKHLTQGHLAEMVNVSSAYISNIETGKQSMSITVFADLCNALGVTADWLLRNNTSESRAISVSEVSELLDDCSEEERAAIIKVVQVMKTAMRSVSQKLEDE